jgi:hypothetical protein
VEWAESSSLTVTSTLVSIEDKLQNCEI